MGRFIPTCVGKLIRWYCGNSPNSVHPHVCGETERCPGCSRGGPGSSPRVWGNSRGGRNTQHPRRFIPTCVGKLPPHPSSSGHPTVHPHVCGETASANVAGIGKTRFIPTCVGKLPSWEPRRISPAVHPHVCGETTYHLTLPNWTSGSSPRVWGNWSFPW